MLISRFISWIRKSNSRPGHCASISSSSFVHGSPDDPVPREYLRVPTRWLAPSTTVAHRLSLQEIPPAFDTLFEIPFHRFLQNYRVFSTSLNSSVFFFNTKAKA